jgi:hypothetical protein
MTGFENVGVFIGEKVWLGITQKKAYNIVCIIALLSDCSFGLVQLLI